jgi:CspA family cold shock protein
LERDARSAVTHEPYGHCLSPHQSCLAERAALQTGIITSYREKDTQMRTTGTVKFFNTAKGFGFIQPENGGKDVFVHATALEAAGIFSLNEGDKVSFVLEDDRKGRGKQAGQIQKA